MNGRDKLLAAFRPEGTPAFAALSCYVSIYIRDHWAALTDRPWWHRGSGRPEWEIPWMQDVLARSGLEWIGAGGCFGRDERQRHRYEQRTDGVWRVDPATAKEERLSEPLPGGTNTVCARDKEFDPDDLPGTREEIDAALPPPPPFDGRRFAAEGRGDVVAAAERALGVCTYGSTNSPLGSLYNLWGYQGMMLMVGSRPGLAEYAARRILEHRIAGLDAFQALGLPLVWIEELFTDQISPSAFRELNVPLMRRLAGEIRRRAMRSIYYYCGNPWTRLEDILAVGADALSFEEGKKGFRIDIEEVARAVDGRCVIFGNLDTVGILEQGSDEALDEELARQVAAGRHNRSRFAMSTGSPVTPATPLARVRRYADRVRALGH